jgi:hypothetical protein
MSAQSPPGIHQGSRRRLGFTGRKPFSLISRVETGSVIPGDPAPFASVRISWAERWQNRRSRRRLAAWATGASPGPEGGHTAAMAVIVVWILVINRAPPLNSTSATLHPAGPKRLGSRAR